LRTDFEVCDSTIDRLLQTRSSIFGQAGLIKSLEVNGLGFDPSMTTFGASLIAKKCRSKTRWDEKLMSLRNGVGLMKLFLKHLGCSLV
jgi:hypothetical protein